MKKYAFLACAALIALIGCGGNGGGGGGGNNGGGGAEFSVNTALLNRPGLLQVTYLTGQGRGTSTIVAVLEQFAIFDNFGQISPLLPPDLFLELDGYTSQTVEFNAPMSGFSTNLNGRTFDLFNLNVDRVILDPGGANTVVTGPGGQSVINVNFPMFARVLPGRLSSMTVFLNDAMIFDDGQGGVTFDQAEFENVNLNPETNRIEGHIADYIAFDITNVAVKPQMLDTSDAEWVCFSGDAIALAKTPDSSGTVPFEVLVPLGPDPGALEGFWQTAPTFPSPAPPTYTLRQIDPRSLPNTARITSLQGTWKVWYDPNDPTNSPFLNPTPFVMIMMPQSQENGIVDLVCFTHTDGAAEVMWFGEANLNTNSFSIWPIDQVDDGDASNEVTGTLGAYIYRAGIGSPTAADIRGGTFSFLTGPVPSAFPSTGSFVVYRL